MAIFKASITVTALIEANSADEVGQELASMSLTDLHYELNEGAYVGQFDVPVPVEVPEDKVVEELKALGNDGLFFSSDE